MKLITISGLDGSGKSTQVQMLKSELERHGSKVFYFHAIEFSLANKIHKLFNNNKKATISNEIATVVPSTGLPRNDSEKSVTHATPFQIFLRKVFLRIDVWRFKQLQSQLCNSGYDYVLSDRYFYDTAINIEFLEKQKFDFLGENYTLNSKRWEKYKILAPDLAIYLQTYPQNIMARERVPDQGLEYLEKKKSLYDAQATDWKMKIIDGNQDKNIIFEKIKKAVILNESLLHPSS